MREIKFRGKRVDNSEWVIGDFYEELNIDGKVLIIPKHKPLGHYVIPETVGQYTGLKDKNDKEIYEGDLVIREAMGLRRINVVGPIIFEEGSFWIECGTETVLLFTEIDTLEVIGNIYDK